MMQLYIAKAGEFYGAPKVRELYEKSLQVLQGQDLIDIGLKFSKFERKLGEIDRARDIYVHLS